VIIVITFFYVAENCD